MENYYELNKRIIDQYSKNSGELLIKDYIVPTTIPKHLMKLNCETGRAFGIGTSTCMCALNRYMYMTTIFLLILTIH